MHYNFKGSSADLTRSCCATRRKGRAAKRTKHNKTGRRAWAGKTGRTGDGGRGWLPRFCPAVGPETLSSGTSSRRCSWDRSSWSDSAGRRAVSTRPRSRAAPFPWKPPSPATSGKVSHKLRKIPLLTRLYLISEDGDDALSRLESLQHLANYLAVRRRLDISLEADVGKFRFRSDVDGHVATLNDKKINSKWSI